MFGGRSGVVYDVTLRIRGLFEPTTIVGGNTPDASHPYSVIGGQSRTLDCSRWHIDVSQPTQTYTLNHYPDTPRPGQMLRLDVVRVVARR